LNTAKELNQRLPHLDKWFVDIGYPSPAIRDG